MVDRWWWGGEKHFSAGLDGVRAEAKSSVKRKKNVSKDRSTFEGGKKSAFIYSENLSMGNPHVYAR